MSMTKIQEIRVGAGGAASIDFDSIPQIFDDLLVVTSIRFNAADENVYIRFNGDSSGYTIRNLLGVGSGNAISQTGGGSIGGVQIHGMVNTTANTFGNGQGYIPNYRSATSKLVSGEGVSEANATGSYQFLTTGVWANNSPITSLRVYGFSGSTILENSSATLYGINRTRAIGRSPQAIGGNITYANGYWIHTFNGSGDFVPFNNMNVEYLVVAGGGGGGGGTSGGGGGGGYRSSVVGEFSGGNSPAESLLSLTAAVRYPVIVGSGGAAGLTDGTDGGNGGNSSFSTITSTGGGGGSHGSTGRAGGSGGGAGYGTAAGGAGTAGQGFAGGSTAGTGPSFFTCGGGGGAGQVGASVAASMNGGAGGAGLPSDITGSSAYYAGGGGGGTNGVTAAGGLGGGGDSVNELNGEAGDPNTGGGGGASGTNASRSGAAGGSGVVIVRYRG